MRHLKDLSIGAVIGAANIIPGVSGGTMALIMGVYEKLLTILSSISFASIKAFLGVFRFNEKGKQQFIAEFKRLEGFFLIKIMVGAIVAILLLASLMTFLLQKHHDPTYGFFFGLVLLSAVYPYKLIRRINPLVVVVMLIGLGSVFAISNSVSNQTLIDKAKQKLQLKAEKTANAGKKENTTKTTSSMKATLPTSTSAAEKSMLYIFILGVVAITAMVLPGVSGSFLLLLLGGYFEILEAIATRDLSLLSIFGVGCLVGLLLSSRLIHFLLNRWHDATMSFLLGLVIGSLWMIWPFKHSMLIGDQVIYLNNKLPTSLGSGEMLTLLTTTAGILTIVAFLWIEKKKP